MIWKDIPNHPGYQASPEGFIKTFNWKGCGREAILKPAGDKKGYLRTVLNGRTIKVHRIIALTFIENPCNKPQVNHINGNKTDNRVINLEWATNKENYDHATSLGLQVYLPGSKNGWSKLNESHILEIRAAANRFYYGRKALAEKYGVKECTIKAIVNRKSWTHI